MKKDFDSKSPNPSRRKFLASAGTASAAAVAAASVASPALAQGTPEVTWRMTASWPKSLDTLFGGAEKISKRVSELTDGKFKIQVFAGGEIVPGLQVLDAVQNGTVECGHTAAYYYFGKNDAFVFGTCLPFGLNSRQQNAWLYQAGGLELFNEFLKGYNCVMMPAGNTNCQMGGWFRKQIKTIDDLKGLKFRVGGFAGKIFEKVGAVPQQIAAGDIYPALEKGTIDGAEWVGPYDDEKLGFYKVARFYHYPGWWEPNSTTAFIINTEKYNGLPELYKQALKSAAAEANMWVMSKYDAVNPIALRDLVSKGAVLTPFSPEVMDVCYKAAQGVYKDLSASNPAFKKLYDHQMKFLNNAYLWTQIADHTMDNYMIRYRNAAHKG